jgi:hypothetical protein
MKRVVYHVTPVGEDWRVKRVGAERAANVFESKKDAIARGKELAKHAGLGQVRVHGKNGDIETEHTYGEDPKRSQG